jgi:hypothetical protein
MPSPGLALTFDPRYVTAAIDAWHAHDLSPISPSDLESKTAQLLQERFIALNVMGMREQAVSMPALTKALGILTSLKLARKITKGKGESHITQLTVTADGREILAEKPVSGTLYPRFAECLSRATPDISTLLDLLAVNGPLTQPIVQPVPGAPRRGVAYLVAVSEGLREYHHQASACTTKPHVMYEPSNPKATAPQRIKAAQTWASQAHPAGALRQLDKAVATSLAFGLLWVDTIQINEVIAARSIGLAATRTSRGFHPNSKSWPSDSAKIIPALIDAVSTRANGSGFATIQEVRGTIGRTLSLSPIAVDALLREARDAGDRHEIPIELHFEPDEDQLYAIQRDPLIWREEAFEFITVLRGARA